MRGTFLLPLERQPSSSLQLLASLTLTQVKGSPLWTQIGEYLFVLGCESPVLVLALFSLQWLKRLLFWLAWGIHAAFTGCVVTVVIWLKYFWHW